MAHYDDIYNEIDKEELKKLKTTLKKKIGEMSNDDVRFIAKVIENLGGYKKFFELLKELSARGC